MTRFNSLAFTLLLTLVVMLGASQTASACNNSYLSLDSVVANGSNKFSFYFQFCVGGGYEPPADTLQGADNSTMDFWFEVYGSGVVLCPGGYPASLYSGQADSGCTNCGTALSYYNSIGSQQPGCCACPCGTSPCPSGDSTCVWYSVNGNPTYYSSLGFPFCPTCPGPPPGGFFPMYTDIWAGSGPAQDWCVDMFLQTKGYPDSIRGHGLENSSGFFGYCLDIDLLIPTFNLPVVWEYFDGEETPTSQIELAWGTAMEQNNSHFEVQKSVDGRSYRNIGTQAGMGDSKGFDEYNFVDANPVTGYQFYRLRQVDLDGKFDYSDVISVYYSGDMKTHLNYISPVPANDQTSVNFFSAEQEDYTLEVYDIQGKMITSSSFEAQTGENSVDVDISAFDTGIYFVKLYSRTATMSGKILKD